MARSSGPVDEPVSQNPDLPRLLTGPRPWGHAARPGNRKAVGADPQASYQVKIGLPPVIVVAGDRSRAAVSDRPLALTERAPDRATPPVGQSDCTFNLIGRRGDSPAEAVGRT